MVKKSEKKSEKKDVTKELSSIKRDKYPENYKIMNEVKIQIQDIEQ